MVDQLLELPLSGRKFAANLGAAGQRAAAAALSSFVAGPENRVVASVVGEWLASAALNDDGADTQERARSALHAPVVPRKTRRGKLPSPKPALLTIYGPSGVGKTHLARGLVDYWRQGRGADAAEYITAGDFRRQFADARKNDDLVAFRSRFRGRQLLALDDLQELPDSAPLMEELRFTFDDYQETAGALLVTARRSVASLTNLPADVRSRLACGLSLQLAAPGAVARRRIVMQSSAALGRSLTDEAAGRLASGIPGGVNELFGALFELLTAANHSVVKTSDVQRLLSARLARRPSLREIIAVVARYYHLPQKQLKGTSRKHTIVMARATVVYLARELAGASYEQIGHALGGRDHSTIMHNNRTIRRERERDWQIQETLDDLRRILLCR